jgi:hypothetical protein
LVSKIISFLRKYYAYCWSYIFCGDSGGNDLFGDDANGA